MSHKQTVLIVDDSQAIRDLIPARLKGLGVHILAADSGAAGLEMVRLHEPDLVLLDVNMPGMSGFEVCQALKNDPQTHDIPIIFLTGSDELLDKVKGFDLGAVDYVTKPFDPVELCARVRAALRTKALMDMLTNQAQLDGLTGLHNRRYFDERLEQELDAGRRYNRSVGLLMLDVDHFKKINDEFGHPRGDEVLRRLANILVTFCRSSDVACRYGGEEFAILLAESGSEHTFQCGRRLLQAIRDSRDLHSVIGRPVTVSIGAASVQPGEGRMLPSVLVDSADRALYAAKNKRDCIIADTGMTSITSAAG